MGALSEVIDVGRYEWTASRPVKPLKYLSSQRWTALEVHHSGVEQRSRTDVEMFQSAYDYHVNSKGWADIWYHLGVDKEGKIYQLRGINAANSARRFLTVLIPGNDDINDIQLASVQEIREAMYANENVGFDLKWHNQRSATACPGMDTSYALESLQYVDPTQPQTDPPTNNNLFDPPLNLEGVIGFVVDPGGQGSWVATQDGGVFTMGDQEFFGSSAGQDYNDGLMVAIDPFEGGYKLTDKHGHEYHYPAKAT